jgi:hypothetical protein
VQTFDWTSIYPYLVAAGNLLGFWVKSRPDTGWFKNVLIPRWTFGLGFAAALILGLQKFGEAAGLSLNFYDYNYAGENTIALAGWSWAKLWPVLKMIVDSLMAGGATFVGAHLTYEKGGLRTLVPITTPKAKRK